MPERAWKSGSGARLALGVLAELNVGIMLLDGAGTVIFWNRWLEDHSGVAAADAHGRAFGDLFPDLAKSFLSRAIAECLSAGRSSVLSHVLHKKLLPLHVIDRTGTVEQMKQQISILPVDDPETGRHCLMQVVDVTLPWRREQLHFENEQRLRALVGAMPDVVCFKDGEGRWLAANPPWHNLCGLGEADCRGLTTAEIAVRHPATAAQLARLDALEAEALGGDAGRRDENLQLPGGVERVFDMIRISIASGKGEAKGLLTIGRDITERRQAEAEKRLAALVVSNSAIPVVVLDSDLRVLTVNPAYIALSGFQSTEVVGKLMADLILWKKDDIITAAMKALEADDFLSGERIGQRADGSTYAQAYAVHRIRDDAGNPMNYVVTFEDISERKQKEDRIRHLAENDTVTGLPNRLLLRDRLERTIARARRDNGRFALLFIDLDGFKPINDIHGHDVGDMLLREVGRRVAGGLRDSDTVARWGGDEFVVLLSDVKDFRGLDAIEQKLLAAIKAPVKHGDLTLSVGASIGRARFPDDGTDLDLLLRLADQSMYKVKQKRKRL